MATIHINPENKGKFTETKRRTGKTTEELTHSKNPLTRKRAIFAQNAKKFKHELGGPLNEESLLGNKIINAPAEYVFNSYLDQPKQYGFGSWLKDEAVPFAFDAAKAYSNIALGAVGIDPNYKYENKIFDKIGSGLNQVGKVGGQIAANVVAPGVGGAALGAVQQGVGAATAHPSDEQIEADEFAKKQSLTQLAQSRMSHGGPLNFNSNVGNQLLSPVAGSITKDLTQSEYDELGQKKVLSDLSRGKLDFANGGKIDMWYGSDDYLNENHLMDKYSTGGKFKELSSNWIIPTYSQGGNFDFMMANGGHPIQPNVQDVDGSNMDVPSTNNNIYTKGGSSFTKRRGGTDQPSEDFTAYNSGQTHEQSPLNGIPVGNKSLTENGEVRYNSKKHGAYIFSNRF